MVKENKNLNKNIRGQAFSADILVVIVIVLFGAIFLVMNTINEEKNEDVEQRAQQAATESRLIVEELKTTGVINAQNQINTNELLTINKEDIKAKLGIENDFAIVFEKNGNLVKIDPQRNITCLGDDSIIVNGYSCQ